MKKLFYSFIFIAAILSGCELDNYDPPKSELTGRLVFEGNPVGIRQGISVLQLTQPSFETQTPINVNVTQDGTFSSKLFDGDYKLVRVSGNGPWEANTTPIDVTVKGATTVDVEVRPYFSISNVSFVVENNIVKATCTVTNNVAGRTVERIALILGKTTIVDDPTRLIPATADPLSAKTGAGLNLSQPITLSQTLAVAPLSTTPYLFARIGLKVTGVPELLYSNVFAITR